VSAEPTAVAAALMAAAPLTARVLLPAPAPPLPLSAEAISD
jgi:hypothetical protein